jgi:hypothetical protein
MVGNARRTQQSFYALWYFLFDIPFESIGQNKVQIRSSLKQLFAYMTDVEDKATFEQHVHDFKKQFPINKYENKYEIAILKDVAKIHEGIRKKEYNIVSIDAVKYNYVSSLGISNYRIIIDKSSTINVEKNFSLIELFDSESKILLARTLDINRLKLAYTQEKLAFGSNILGIIINRPMILPKYVSILLSSRFYYNKYILLKSKEALISNVSASDIINLEIPVLPIEQQHVFELIFEYISNSESQSKIALFFERIADAMVYEIFFEEQFLNSDIKIRDYVSCLPKLNDLDYEKKIKNIEEVYNIYSSQEHKIGAELIRLMNIPAVRYVENIF